MTQGKIRLLDLFKYYKKLGHQTAGIQELEEQILYFCPDCFDRNQGWYRTWSTAVAPKPDRWYISRDQVAEISGWKPNQFDDNFMNDLNALVFMTGMTGLEQRRHLVSQTAHETGRYRWMKELGDEAYFTRMYDNRSDLGNGPGDGKVFFGGGAIQLTGRYNYQRFSDWLERNGLADDRVMEEGANYVADKYPFLSAVCWIEENNWAEVCQTQDVYQVTRVLNGGYNGIDDRLALYEKARKAISV